MHSLNMEGTSLLSGDVLFIGVRPTVLSRCISQIAIYFRI
jgi:hypothetical protein